MIFIFRNYADLFTPNDRVLLQSFADQAAIAVFNAQLYGQVSYEKQRLDALLDSAADGILILDTDQIVERCNTAFEKLYGLSREDIVGKKHGEIIAWKKEPQGKTLEESIADGWPLTPNATLYVEGDIERPLPPHLPVGITYAPLLSSENKLRNVIVSVRDITHFRTADEIKATFISIVSHELRTPVTLIKGYASTLLAEDVEWDSKSQKEFISIISDETDRLTNLVNNLLDLSRMEAGSLRLSLEKCSVADTIHRAAKQARSSRMEIKIEAGADFVQADPMRLETILRNLFENAIKYGGENVNIEAKVTRERGAVIFRVIDDGPGISSSYHEKVFEMFQTLKPRDEVEGSGLGLSLVRKTVESLGGEIQLKSQGRGCCFCFSWPKKIVKKELL